MKKRIALIRSTFLVFFISISFWATAQLSNDSNFVEISAFRDMKEFSKNCVLFIDSNYEYSNPSNIPIDRWEPLASKKNKQKIPDYWITKPVYLKFTLKNSADTALKVYLLPGVNLRSLNVYKLLPDHKTEQLKDESREDGYQPIEIAGKAKQEFIAKLYFTKNDNNILSPVLIKRSYFIKFKNNKHFTYEATPAIGYLLSGVLLMMIFFTAVNFIITGKKEFLLNCLYSVCMFLLVLLNTFLERKSGVLMSLFLEYFDFMLLSTGTIFYIAFTRKFLETKTNFPLLNKIFILAEKLIIIVLLCFTFIVFFTNYYQLQRMLENGMKGILLAIGILYIVIAIVQKNKLMNYLAIGNALLIFFSIISFLMILFQKKSINIFTSSMIYFEIGIVSELIFFLLGLSYKNRIELIEKIKEQESLKLEAEKQSYENKLAILNAQQAERNRISADMHDGLGAGVTAIRLYSELAKKRIGKDVIPEIEKISSSANDLLNNMNAIIWTMTSSNDTFHNMVGYIRSYAQEYFENTGINCYISIEEDIPNVTVSGEIRRNVFMVIKEALNNILKHSGATQVNITLKREIRKEKNGLSLYIHDNGKGIDFDKLRRFGNGLINMKKRMEAMQILFLIENNNGTLVTLYSNIDF